jgi:hypothetical protein
LHVPGIEPRSLSVRLCVSVCVCLSLFVLLLRTVWKTERRRRGRSAHARAGGDTLASSGDTEGDELRSRQFVACNSTGDELRRSAVNRTLSFSFSQKKFFAYVCCIVESLLSSLGLVIRSVVRLQKDERREDRTEEEGEKLSFLSGV